jgi:hypothetical protein
VSGYDLTGSTATSFLFGIVVGAVASLALRLLLTVPRPAASRAADARRTDARLHREMAFINGDRDNRLEHQEQADSARAHDPSDWIPTKRYQPKGPAWLPTQQF